MRPALVAPWSLVLLVTLVHVRPFLGLLGASEGKR